MTQPAEDQVEEHARWRRQFVVAAAVLAGFAVLVAVMIWLARSDDGVWQRRVYVFGAVEAIVFTTLGWLFGQEVGRAGLSAARADSTQARQEAEAARTEARQVAEQAATANVSVAELQAHLTAIRAAARAAEPAAHTGPQDVGARHDGDQALDLRSFIEHLLGPAPVD